MDSGRQTPGIARQRQELKTSGSPVTSVSRLNRCNLSPFFLSNAEIYGLMSKSQVERLVLG
jgi:hypothetical protein